MNINIRTVSTWSTEIYPPLHQRPRLFFGSPCVCYLAHATKINMTASPQQYDPNWASRMTDQLHFSSIHYCDDNATL